MVNGDGLIDVLTNETLTGVLPHELVASLGTLITIFKAVGIVVIVYVIFLIMSSYLNIKRGIRIKKIAEKVEIFDKKIDKLLEKQKIKFSENKVV